MADAGDGWKSLIQAHWVLAARTASSIAARANRARRRGGPQLPRAQPARHAPHRADRHARRRRARRLDRVQRGDQRRRRCSPLPASAPTTSPPPDGIAIKVHKGDQLLLNLHLFNVSDKPIEGTSGTLVKLMPEDEIVHEAESVLGGHDLDLDIPPHSKDVVQSGACTMVEDATLFAVGASRAHACDARQGHRAQLESTATSCFPTATTRSIRRSSTSRSDGEDEAGRSRCRWTAPTTTTATSCQFGDSSLAEMCFAGFLRYPAVENPRSLY